MLNKVWFSDFRLAQEWFTKYRGKVQILNIERYDVTRYVIYYIGNEQYE